VCEVNVLQKSILTEQRSCATECHRKCKFLLWGNHITFFVTKNCGS